MEQYLRSGTLFESCNAHNSIKIPRAQRYQLSVVLVYRFHERMEVEAGAREIGNSERPMRLRDYGHRYKDFVPWNTFQ